MINLTETQRIKDALEANPENYQDIIEDCQIGICITDEQGLYFTMNKKYLEIVGYESDEMKGKSFLMVVPPPKQVELKELHDEFIDSQIEIFEKFEILGKMGNRIGIDVDAGFNDKIAGSPHKITFIQIAS
jgi:PAS domain S-box-containing protein